jgi:Spy/CpxP family protein refolding chaperone
MFETTNRRRLAIGAAVGLIAGALGVVAVQAQPGPPPGRGPWGRHMGGPPAGRLGFALGQLDLTEAQREQIRAIHQTHRQETQAAGQQVTAARQALDQAVASGADEGAIRGAAAKLGEAIAEASVLRAKVHAEVLQVLTPEQQAKARELRAQFQERAKLRQQRMKLRMKQQRPAPPPAGGML